MKTTRDFGRSAALEAALVQLVSMFSIALAFLAWSRLSDTNERYVITALASIVAFVSGLWVLLLASRAVYRGTCSSVVFIPWVMFELITLVVVVSAGPVTETQPIANALNAIGLPLFFPFFAITSIFSMTAAACRLRRKHPHLAHSAKWRKGLRFYLASMVVTTILLLPWPLFIYCTCHRSYWNESETKVGWQNFIADHAPEFVGDFILFVIFKTDGWNGISGIRYDCAASILSSGRCSHETMMDHIEHPIWHPKHDWEDGDDTCALRGLEKNYPNEALLYALQNKNWFLDGQLGQIVGRLGTPEQIRSALQPDFKSEGFFWGLCVSLGRDSEARKRPEFLPDLKRIVSDDSLFCGEKRRLGFYALVRIAELLPDDEIEAQWSEYVQDDIHPKRKAEALRLIKENMFKRHGFFSVYKSLRK